MRNIAAYVPTEEALLYHYCSAETLLAVLKSSSLRLGDVSEMNDSMERHWGHEALAQELERQRKEAPEEFMDFMDAAVLRSMNSSICLASCFSTQSDVLSQWRAYAENGAGFAIGLDPFVLQAMPVTLLEVCYDRQAQAERIADGVAYLRELHQLIGRPEPALEESLTDEQLLDDGSGWEPLLRAQIDRFSLAVRFLTYDLVAFKNPAFSEESEVRLVHYALLNEQQGVELVPVKSPSRWPGGREPKLDFRMRGSVPICYLDVPISQNAIKEVVIGPRAIVEEDALTRLLATLGYRGVEISRSVASYR
ncbi:DUF2971 domain-containing protein [Stenotrophomonas geniculata]